MKRGHLPKECKLCGVNDTLRLTLCWKLCLVSVRDDQFNFFTFPPAQETRLSSALWRMRCSFGHGDRSEFDAMDAGRSRGRKATRSEKEKEFPLSTSLKWSISPPIVAGPSSRYSSPESLIWMPPHSADSLIGRSAALDNDGY